MSELKPCPFCGGEAVETFAGVSCTECGGTMHGGIQYGGADWDGVIDAWNTRAERTCGVDGTIQWQWMGPTTYFEYELSCGHVITSTDEEPPNYCEECGAKVVVE